MLRPEIASLHPSLPIEVSVIWNIKEGRLSLIKQNNENETRNYEKLSISCWSPFSSLLYFSTRATEALFLDCLDTQSLHSEQLKATNQRDYQREGQSKDTTMTMLHNHEGLIILCFLR